MTLNILKFTVIYSMCETDHCPEIVKLPVNCPTTHDTATHVKHYSCHATGIKVSDQTT